MATGITPLPKVRTYTYGGTTSVMQMLSRDVEVFTRDSIIQTLRLTAAEETADQIRLGNPPEVAIVDGTRGKKVSEAMKRVEVAFGLRLPSAALAFLKGLLQKNIQRATRRRTGALSNVAQNWSFVNQSGTAPPIGNRGGIPMTVSDFIVLRPSNVPHATVANIAATQKRSRAVNMRREAKGQAPKSGGGVGFMAQTTRAARRSPLFANFNVAVRFTDYSVSGEKWGRGLTATIIITPKIGKRSRGRRR